MKEEDESDLATLTNGANLIDACRSLDCAEPNRIDRIMLRSSASIELSFSNWRVDESFVDSAQV